MKGYLNRESKPAFALRQFVESRMEWERVERQLVVREQGNKFFAHVGFYLL